MINRTAKRALPLATAMSLLTPVTVLATNGMNLEGYGPEAHAMGGASMAYDNGTAAVMNNPATLGMMSEGNRLDVALGALGINIDASNDFGAADSSADAFYMPAVGWARKTGPFAYGVGMFAQGGMGAEYSGGSAVDLSGPQGVNFVGAITPAPAQNTDSHTQRSEVGVGRLIFPFTFSVNKQLNLGATLDYVWGGMDIMWSMDAVNFLGALDTANINDLAPGNLGFLATVVGPQNVRGRMSGSMVDRFVAGFDTAAYGGPNPGNFTNFYWGHFEFSDSSSFTQEAKGTGFGGKIGGTYQINNQFTLGATYHTKTSMDDFKGDVTVSFKVDTSPAAGGITGAVIPVTGEVTVVDFQWPETYAIGMAYKASDKFSVVADFKRIMWSDVMENFHMKVKADNTQANPFAAGFAGSELDFVYYQNWEDQNVLQLGLGYQHTNQLTYRFGYNYASNPVPDDTVNFLFPATIESHYTAGVGYLIDKSSGVNFSLAYAPKVTVTESKTESNNLGTTSPNTVEHSQTNWQLMYTYMF